MFYRKKKQGPSITIIQEACTNVPEQRLNVFYPDAQQSRELLELIARKVEALRRLMEFQCRLYENCVFSILTNARMHRKMF